MGGELVEATVLWSTVRVKRVLLLIVLLVTIFIGHAGGLFLLYPMGIIGRHLPEDWGLVPDVWFYSSSAVAVVAYSFVLRRYGRNAARMGWGMATGIALVLAFC